MSAWGRTGRVVLSAEYVYGDVTRDVVVDDAVTGRVLAPRGEEPFTGWGAINRVPHGYGDHLPSLDHAVMWVLRRAAPDVWREERGPVWRVMRKDCFWWAYPKGASRGRPRAHADQGSAVIYADRRAREATS